MLEYEQWKNGFAATEKIQRVRPARFEGYLDNPHRGTTTFQRFEGDALQADHSWHDDRGPVQFNPPPAKKPAPVANYPTTRVAYCRWPWSVLEPARGEIRFDLIHSALKTAAAHDQSLQIRFEPFVMDDIPKWYVETGAGLLPGNPGPEIDSNDPRYIEHWTRFVRALGAEFNAHPNLDSVDVAYAGRYGEMGGNATLESARKLVDAYVETFPDTFLLGMIGAAGCAYAASLPTRNFGWRGDGFLDVKFRAPGIVPDGLVWHHMFDEYPRHLIEQNLRDRWQHAPVSLEPYHTVWHLLKAEGFSHDIAWQLDQCLKYHPSTFMAKSVEIPEPWMDVYQKFDLRLGYRFHLHQMTLPLSVSPGQQIEAAITIDNRGVAPIYRPYKFALRFVQNGRESIVKFNADIRRWLPDFSFEKEMLSLPESLQPGKARVDGAIVDEGGNPRVKLAIAETDAKGWHPLTFVNVVKA